ncbi:acylphosphatase [Weissella diestrammenae]|uniref:Acylphosphatase n=1 Tax=Weissella diestrammenae TaxID=1162633 RepID=A0A7G9T765_9LACO|nr:acylphosphatase [Weissella diestrammenae]MCM0582458.1 acylphosphatase [Weissella diestrammenae]QNN75940.1 acylphosphatase [Weissella diestrammenae]
MQRAIILNIDGLVQGVGFRWATKKLADEYRLVGFVKSLSDGSVEVFVQGNDQQIERFISSMHRGTFPFTNISHMVQTETQLASMNQIFSIIK